MAPPEKYLTRDEFWRLLRSPEALAALLPVVLSDPVQTSGRLPFSRLVEASASKLIIARRSAGGGDWEECTLSQVLDFIPSGSDFLPSGAAHGDILYRGSSEWKRLGAGANGKILTTHGVGADLTWETGGGGGGGGWTLLEEHVLSNQAAWEFNTRNVSGQSGDTFQSDFDEYVFELVNVKPLADANLFWLVSTDNGSTYDASSSYYHQQYVWRAGGSALIGQIPDTGAFLTYYNAGDSVESSDACGVNGTFRLYGPLASTATRMFGTLQYKESSGGFHIIGHVDVGWESNTAVNACKFYYSGTNSDGIMRCYGVPKS